MFKSFNEMKKVMIDVLKLVCDEKFDLDTLYNKYEKTDVDEAVFTCVKKELVIGIKAERSESNSVVLYFSNPIITYDGLAFIEEN